jgi:hypothetical protein
MDLLQPCPYPFLLQISMQHPQPMSLKARTKAKNRLGIRDWKQNTTDLSTAHCQMHMVETFRYHYLHIIKRQQTELCLMEWPRMRETAH